MTTTAQQIASQVAAEMPAAEVFGRDIHVPDALVTEARDLAHTFGAEYTQAAPAALFGTYKVTVWTE